MTWPDEEDNAESEWGKNGIVETDSTQFTHSFSYGGYSHSGGGDRACHTCGEEGHSSRECPSKPARNNSCFKCGAEGHIFRDCPQKTQNDSRACHKCNEEGHIARDCSNAPAITCRKCNEEGHMSRECPNAPPVTCRRCKEEGHMSRDCPNSGPEKCYNCGQEGHQSRDCPEERRERKPMTCHRCQREGHRATECSNEAVQRIDGAGKSIPTAVTYIPAENEDTDAAFERLHYSEANVSRFDTMQVTVSDPKFELPLSDFEEAGFCDNLMQKVKLNMRFSRPTPIQKFCIPIIKEGRDLIGCSQTGSGKSAAFILPILDQLFNDPELPPRDQIRGQKTQYPLVVVLSPTRELCYQLYEHFRLFSEEQPRRIGVSPAYGGTQVRYNVEQIRSGTHVLCAVPGRLNQFLEDKTISFAKLRYFVLDEADRMLDEGFSESIRSFHEHPSMVAKDRRQTLMFSATFTHVEQLARRMMKPDAVKVVVGILGGVNRDVEQQFIEASDSKTKRETLKMILDQIPGCKSDQANQQPLGPRDKVMVFVEKKKDTDMLASYLNQTGYSSTSMHGDRDQQQREQALQTFRTGKHAVLVATEVAARGLDIKGVALVVNYDMPKDIDKFVHRVGRTGRVGVPGRAISFFDVGRDAELAPELVKVLNECGQPVPDFISRAADDSGSSFAGFNAIGNDEVQGDAGDQADGWGAWG